MFLWSDKGWETISYRLNCYLLIATFVINHNLTSFNLSVAVEFGFWDLGKDWVVSSGCSGNRLEEPVSSLMIFLGFRLGWGLSLESILGLWWGTIVIRGTLLATLARTVLLSRDGNNSQGWTNREKQERKRMSLEVGIGQGINLYSQWSNSKLET